MTLEVGYLLGINAKYLNPVKVVEWTKKFGDRLKCWDSSNPTIVCY